MATGEAERRGRGRPRTPGADERILNAALEEYAALGWSGFTMDGVSRRAGLGKSTLYLRWSDKEALLTDAVRMRTQAITDVDTGSLRGDLQALAVSVIREFIDQQGWATFRMVVESASVARPLGSFTRAINASHREAVEEIFGRARERGEVSDAVDQYAIVDLVYGAGLSFVLGRRLDHAPITDDEIDARVDVTVDLILKGLQ